MVYRADIAVIVFDANHISKELEDKYDKLINDKCKKNVQMIHVVNKIDLCYLIERKKNYCYVSCETQKGIK
jgi:tRNA U34 5-carboxymethylaminomethyl modifying GTPase MnmE/TrmE